MTIQDVNLGNLPTDELDLSAFTGTSDNTPSYETEDIGTDRGDELEPDAVDPNTPSTEENEAETPPETEDDTPTPDEEAPAEAPTDDPAEEPETSTDEEPQAPNKKRVPYDRFKKELEKRKSLEAELAKLREAQPDGLVDDINVGVDFTPDAVKFKAMTDAMLEGNSEAASAIFTETLQAAMNSAANAAAKAATERAFEVARNEAESALQSRNIIGEVQQAAEIVMSEYDIFNDQTDSFDEGIFNEALRVRDGLIATGMNAGEAILEAAELVAARHGHQARSSVPATPTPPPVKQPNIKTKLEQAAKTPPRVGGEAHDAKPALDIMNMSVEEFDKLDPKEIARLRGDFDV